MADFTKKNLNEIEDAAVEGGFSDVQMARFAGADLGCESIGLAFEGVKPNSRQAFGHIHEKAEEVYVVISGSGRMKLGDELIDVGPLDAIRVAPTVMRSFEAGPDGLEMIAFGTRHDKDGDIDTSFWDDVPPATS